MRLTAARAWCGAALGAAAAFGSPRPHAAATDAPEPPPAIARDADCAPVTRMARLPKPMRPADARTVDAWPASAATRDRALVLCVGLDAYRRQRPLRRAESDARRVAAALKARGFRVHLLVGPRATLADVRRALSRGPVAVYFAGHAERGRLVLADGELPLREAGGCTDVLLLDGCTTGEGLVNRGATRVYAAARHHAFEGENHGLFTRHLLAWLKAGHPFCGPGMAAHIARGVRHETGGWQVAAYGYLPGS